MTRPGQAQSDPEIETEVPVGLDALPEAEPHPRRMLDRYEVIAQIAKGGMGTVFLARREGAGGFGRLSAIKVLHEHLAEDDTFVSMLLDEARTAAHIHHPNAIGIDDVAESTVGHYLVMAYVDGFNLAQIMTDPALRERERIRICARLIVDAANGLHAAHTAKNAEGEKLGIVHRDVSPQNVLVGVDGMGRIVDFGIALAASRIAQSRPGTLKGKPQYMAPEQARGEPCDARTDVFALGVVLWEALTLERLFYGEMDVAILVQVMDCIVPDPRERNPNAPAALAEVAMKALSKRPADRYASARDMAVALERAGASAGWIASSSEVEETILRVFGPEIRLKEEAVKRHLASSTGAAEPLQKGQLALVPRLLPKNLVPKRAELGTRADKIELPSGVRERSGEIAAHAPPSASSSSPALAAPVSAAESAAATSLAPASTRVGRSGLALGVLGIALALAALGVWAMSSSAPPASPTPVAARPSPLAASSAPVIAEPASPAPVIAEPASPPPVTAEPEVVPPAAPEASAVAAEHTHHGHAHAPPATGSVPASEVSAPPPASTGLTIETNPYLTH